MEKPVKRPMVPPMRLIWLVSLISLSLSTSSKEAVSKKIWTNFRVESSTSIPVGRIRYYLFANVDKNCLMLLTKRFVFCACSSVESKVSRVVPLELPVFFHQEVEGLHVLFYSAVSAFPYRLIVPRDIGVDPGARGFAVKSLARCIV